MVVENAQGEEVIITIERIVGGSPRLRTVNGSYRITGTRTGYLKLQKN
ncbi:MAG: hypothetical protein FWE25_06965 [Lachnospiraceae bacterium]|nr:hypothetical protein [Lachnospiraceae bacterium]